MLGMKISITGALFALIALFVIWSNPKDDVSDAFKAFVVLVLFAGISVAFAGLLWSVWMW